MTVTEFKTRCENWTDSDEEFSLLVKEGLNLGVTPLMLSIEFEVAGSTVARWGNGITYPLPRMQKLIINYLANQVK